MMTKWNGRNRDVKTPHCWLIRLLSIVILHIIFHCIDAYIPVQQVHSQNSVSTQIDAVSTNKPLQPVPSSSFLRLQSTSSPSNSDFVSSDTNATPEIRYTYNNIEFRIEPWLKNKSEDNSDIGSRGIPSYIKSIIRKSSILIEKSILKIASNLIRLDCKLKKSTPPKVLCPKSGQAVLEAYVKRDKGIGALLPFKKKIARFGMTTRRGPSAPPIIATIQKVYNQSYSVMDPGIGAIIYMFIEPEYRSTGLGELALEVISSIHAIQGCDFTVLVADDDGSGKLVEWYSKNGFDEAPLMQELMGNPGGEYGITMIRPTCVSSNFYEQCNIK